MDDLNWTPPGPGPWQQDRAHNSAPLSPLAQAVFSASFGRGFAESFAAWGVLLDRIAFAAVNGFAYLQPQPFDMPGPDGPRDELWIHAEFGRRIELAARAFADRIWRDAMRRWDEELKPRAVAAHAALASVDLAALDAAGVRDHFRRCVAHAQEMVYQHHRFNAHALVPLGDFCLQVSRWTGRPPQLMLGVFDGYSPASSVASPEIDAAVRALRVDADARALLHRGDDPAEAARRLRRRPRSWNGGRRGSRPGAPALRVCSGLRYRHIRPRMNCRHHLPG